MEIRYVKSEDKLAWNKFDSHLPEAVFEEKERVIMRIPPRVILQGALEMNLLGRV